MVIPTNIIISSLIGLVAVIVSIISLLEVRKQTKQNKEQGEKQTKLLENIANALPYVIKSKSVTDKKSKTGLTQNQKKSDDIKNMRLELQKEKFQWQKNKDIAKGISWIIDHLDSDDDDD